jgi:hypothetical protein
LLWELDVLAEARRGPIKLDERVAARARDEHKVARGAVLSAGDIMFCVRLGCWAWQWVLRRSTLD